MTDLTQLGVTAIKPDASLSNKLIRIGASLLVVALVLWGNIEII